MVQSSTLVVITSLKVLSSKIRINNTKPERESELNHTNPSFSCMTIWSWWCYVYSLEKRLDSWPNFRRYIWRISLIGITRTSLQWSLLYLHTHSSQKLICSIKSNILQKQYSAFIWNTISKNRVAQVLFLKVYSYKELY